ncbi:MAG: radical SAM protein [Chitinispirillaceae bacterium]|nr:radical SAM protein [Chitinispirillaceae bacterium]
MKPILLHYYVTTRCNSRCSFCDIWKNPAMPDASLPEVSANLAAARQAGCRFVDFTGGEPLLNKRLPQFLDEAKRLGYVTSVTTNCLLFPERARELAGLVDLLHFSISGGTPEVHDRLRGTASFGSVVESIDAALRNELVPDLLFTYTSDNINDFGYAYRLAREKKLMIILDPVFNTGGEDTLPVSVHRRAAEYSKRPGVYCNRAHLTLRRRGGNSRTSPLCRAVDSTVVILPDNSLALPCFHHRIRSFPIKNNLDVILAGEARREAARMQGRYDFCERCHINCYFDPSYLHMRNLLFMQSVLSKLRYAWRKYVIYKRHFPLFKRGPAQVRVTAAKPLSARKKPSPPDVRSGNL